MKFKGAFYSVFICTTHVRELNQMELANDGLLVGAAVTLTKLTIKLKELLASLPPHKTKAFAALMEMLRWFAGQQIRNVAVSLMIMLFPSLVPRPLPVFQCCTLKTRG